MFQFSAADLVIGAAAGKGDKHHYIPVFYSKEWAGEDGRLCQYSRPYDVVKPKSVHPDATGYVRGLYTVPRNNNPEVAEYIERSFFNIADSKAATALRLHKSGKPVVWTTDTRSAWSRFIISLIMRNPEGLARISAEVTKFYSGNDLNERYQRIRKSSDPETYDEFMARTEHTAGRASAMAFQKIVDSPTMGNQLNKMRWGVITFANAKHTLLTSDRPIVMTNGLAKPSDNLALPIGPLHVFIATNNIETEDAIRQLDARQLMAQVNGRVVAQARKFVYGTDDSQLRFVSKRFGQMLPSTPLETPPPR